SEIVFHLQRVGRERDDRVVVIARYIAMAVCNLGEDGALLTRRGSTRPRRTGAVGHERNDLVRVGSVIDGVDAVGIAEAAVSGSGVNGRVVDVDGTDLCVRGYEGDCRGCVIVAIRFAHESQVAIGTDREDTA